MDAKLVLFYFGLIILVTAELTQAQISFKKGSCPRRKVVYHCNPTCMNDHQCPSSQKCCPNKCGSVSCVEASPVYTGSNGAGYRAVVRDVRFSCGTVRCNKWEKCEVDRTTRREKCVRVSSLF